MELGVNTGFCVLLSATLLLVLVALVDESLSGASPSSFESFPPSPFDLPPSLPPFSGSGASWLSGESGASSSFFLSSSSSSEVLGFGVLPLPEEVGVLRDPEDEERLPPPDEAPPPPPPARETRG